MPLVCLKLSQLMNSFMFFSTITKLPDVKVDANSNLDVTDLRCDFPLSCYSSFDHGYEVTPGGQFFVPFGAHSVMFGTEAGFGTASRILTKCNAGLGLKKLNMMIVILMTVFHIQQESNSGQHLRRITQRKLKCS